MQISELIKKLEEIRDEHGDLLVKVSCTGGERTPDFATAFDNNDNTQNEFDEAMADGFKPTHVYIN